ncbi:rCG63663 [Rattus norvegicus]|nr:rCG63663 [Rattus norvegicus]
MGHPFSASATKALLRSPYIPDAKAVENNKAGFTAEWYDRLPFSIAVQTQKDKHHVLFLISSASDPAAVAMLMPKKNRIAIYELLFKEGVMVAKKDVHMPKHPELADKNVPNLHVTKATQSLESRG